jgi:uncharacterized protein YjdB
MKHKMTLALILLCFGAAIFATGCGSGPYNAENNPAHEVNLQSIDVTGASSSILVGDTEQLTATGLYSDGSKEDLTSSAGWSSSPISVATVSISGLVSGKGVGSATITATSGSVAGSFTLTVKSPPSTVKSVTVSCVPSAILDNQTSTCSAVVQGDNNPSEEVTWTASPGTIRSSGVYSPPPNVTATVTAQIIATSVQDTSKTGIATITVNPVAAINSVTAACSPTNILVGHTSTCTATLRGIGNFNSAVTWSTPVSNVATVNANGVVTGVGPGTATITATSVQTPSISGSATVTVTESVTLQSLSVTPKSATVTAGQQVQLTATGYYSDNSTKNLTNSSTWSSSNNSVATVNGAGGVTGAAPGSATVSATYQGSPTPRSSR